MTSAEAPDAAGRRPCPLQPRHGCCTGLPPTVSAPSRNCPRGVPGRGCPPRGCGPGGWPRRWAGAAASATRWRPVAGAGGLAPVRSSGVRSPTSAAAGVAGARPPELDRLLATVVRADGRRHRDRDPGAGCGDPQLGAGRQRGALRQRADRQAPRQGGRVATADRVAPVRHRREAPPGRRRPAAPACPAIRSPAAWRWPAAPGSSGRRAGRPAAPRGARRRRGGRGRRRSSVGRRAGRRTRPGRRRRARAWRGRRPRRRRWRWRR